MKSEKREGWGTRFRRLQEWHTKYASTPTRVFCGPDYDSWCWVWLEYYWQRHNPQDAKMFSSYERRTEDWHSHMTRPKGELT